MVEKSSCDSGSAFLYLESSIMTKVLLGENTPSLRRYCVFISSKKKSSIIYTSNALDVVEALPFYHFPFALFLPVSLLYLCSASLALYFLHICVFLSPPDSDATAVSRFR